MNPVPHAAYYWQHIAMLLAGGGIGVKVSNMLSKMAVALPPLPENATFWQQFGYRLIQVFGGIEPGKVVSK